MKETIHSTNNDASLRNFGSAMIRVALAIILIWVGCLKFTTYEADGILPLVKSSPLLSWILGITDIYSLAKFLGVIEIVAGIFILLKKVSPQLSFIGAIGAIITFFITLTFLFSAPPAFQPGMGFPFLSPMPGQFLLKDLLLISASVYLAGDSWLAARMRVS